MSAADFSVRENDEATATGHLIQPWPVSGSIGQTSLETIGEGDGIYIWDENGRRLIDGPAGMWCTNVGHRNREIAEVMREQALELSYNSPWYTTNSPANNLARMIAERAPGDLEHVFFTTGGSTAIETALRFIFYFNNALGCPDRKIVVTREGAYHGSTYLSASLNGEAKSSATMDYDQDLVARLSCPDPRNRAPGESEEDFAGRLVDEFAALIERLGADRIAAFVGEPVMASGGVIVPPIGYYRRMSELCRKHGILFVADEVVTAFGRLGAMFASEEIFDATPDIVAFAKGVTSGYFPLGGVAISSALMEKLRASDQPDAMFAHGLTYSSHPVGCAVAIRNIELLEGGILDHARLLAPYFQEQLAGLRNLPGVADVRGMGLMACVEMDQSAGSGGEQIAARIDRHCQEMGLLVRPLGNMCVMSPPLIITRSQIDDLVDILRKGIERAVAECSVAA